MHGVLVNFFARSTKRVRVLVPPLSLSAAPVPRHPRFLSPNTGFCRAVECEGQGDASLSGNGYHLPRRPHSRSPLWA
ncbi:hypothetical protein BD309DRAFT_991777 [Dichomitus squalens]|uniref:Uncharacterized protein n=2 Tax=Dichomitus squalens TaxID=114155 RepID=A0A4Q9PEQ2_9APHY|nr:uncharacterized protein DICSQDRAFT_141012 [Dichomitus squalens LYAD-421 SS1]EJF56758.1 hypothetical protein DICSQDRAFT_141012 [Dichomitus squalens LYAD-421 SS1]TBU27396.1 hypothetical protein BD311DRAFT_665597 [Dichomitus squalens]TBU42333.1 hypothetical protein BD309DRAFT_991777 [Dichomitus squalens]TBU52605.1 hypothetical protein BD310DRAFT_952632 [Dichomitus squalens]